MKSEVKWWTFQTLFDFTRKVREEPFQIKNIFLTKSYFIYISGFQTELKSQDLYHGHEVAEPDEDHQDSAGQTLAAVDAVRPLLDLAGK